MSLLPACSAALPGRSVAAPPLQDSLPRHALLTVAQVTEILLCVIPPFANTYLYIQWWHERRERTDRPPDVQISTGVSQWDLPTSAAPIGGGSHSSTPAQTANPYDKPADGSQGPGAAEGTRGAGDGPTGDRAGGLGVRPVML